MAGILTNQQLRSKLPAGITVSSVTYPDADSCLQPVLAFLQACEDAQVEQNATAPTGEDVQLISVGQGAETTITRDNVTHRVRQVSRTITAFEKQTVSDVFPVLA